MITSDKMHQGLVSRKRRSAATATSFSDHSQANLATISRKRRCLVVDTGAGRTSQQPVAHESYIATTGQDILNATSYWSNLVSLMITSDKMHQLFIPTDLRCTKLKKINVPCKTEPPELG